MNSSHNNTILNTKILISAYSIYSYKKQQAESYIYFD